jgi:hypothetical protein
MSQVELDNETILAAVRSRGRYLDGGCEPRSSALTMKPSTSCGSTVYPDATSPRLWDLAAD